MPHQCRKALLNFAINNLMIFKYLYCITTQNDPAVTSLHMKSVFVAVLSG